MINFRKTITTGLAVTALGMGIAATSTPAAAWGYHHPWGWGIGGLAAGLALGAAAAAPYYYGDEGCYLARQPVVDAYGNVIGYRRIRVCN
ncbi:MAG TPA: hypothetical protein VMU78_00380 [Methylocella sp.]|nr:hypothetical protein [Methylocella sp.]